MSNNNSDKEQAPPKPKAVFQMNFTIWDDGEITRDLIEKVQGERGAPKAWRLEPRDFSASAKQLIGEKTKIFSAILASLDITEDEMKKSYSIDKVTQSKIDKISSALASSNKSQTQEDDLSFEEK